MFGTKWPSMMSICRRCRASSARASHRQMRKFAARMEKASSITMSRFISGLLELSVLSFQLSRYGRTEVKDRNRAGCMEIHVLPQILISTSARFYRRGVESGSYYSLNLNPVLYFKCRFLHSASPPVEMTI